MGLRASLARPCHHHCRPELRASPDDEDRQVRERPGWAYGSRPSSAVAKPGGLVMAHRQGTPRGTFRLPEPMDIPDHMPEGLPERFWVKVRPDPQTGCWIWVACRTADGYGRFGFGGRRRGQGPAEVAGGTGQAHRFAYIMLRGPVPEGLVLDHLCRTPPCVNPWHLETVTPAEHVLRGDQANALGWCRSGRHPWVPENILIDGKYQRCRECRNEWARGRTPGVAPALRTHCPQGHPYSGDNLYVTPTGERGCRTCHRERQRARYRARAAAVHR